jgi:hypothetical protein
MGVYVAFQVRVCAVPLSRIRKISLLPSTGVPVGAAMVRVAAWAVKLYWSYALMFGDKVAVDAVDEVRGL